MQEGDEQMTVVLNPPHPTTFDHDSRVPDSSPGEANKERNIGSTVAHHGQLVAFWFCLIPQTTKDVDEQVTVVLHPPHTTTLDPESRVLDSSPNKERSIGPTGELHSND